MRYVLVLASCVAIRIVEASRRQIRLDASPVVVTRRSPSAWPRSTASSHRRVQKMRLRSSSDKPRSTRPASHRKCLFSGLSGGLSAGVQFCSPPKRWFIPVFNCVRERRFCPPGGLQRCKQSQFFGGKRCNPSELSGQRGCTTLETVAGSRIA
jgi:hypothetical protein